MAKNENTIREIAILFSHVLRNLRPPELWGVYAFSDVFLILKDFDEKCDKSVDSRLGGISCGGATFLPDAIELALNRLKNVQQDLKVIVVISDGEPHGYPGIEEAMKKAMKRVERSEVITIGLGFGYRRINRFFRNYFSVKSIQELPKEFIRQYFALVWE
jgi:nitric oxide reductase activation protein